MIRDILKNEPSSKNGVSEFNHPSEEEVSVFHTAVIVLAVN